VERTDLGGAQCRWNERLINADRRVRRAARRRARHPYGLRPKSSGPRTSTGNNLLGAVSCPGLYVLATSTHVMNAGTSGPGGWLTLASGVAIGALSIVVAIRIAWWQRLTGLRDRAAEREQELTRERERVAQEEKMARREVWRAEYEDIRNVLDSGEILVYRSRHDGPYTATEFAALDIAAYRMKCERLAERGVKRMRKPLLQIARKAGELTQNALPEEAELALSFAKGHIPGDVGLRDVQRLAINQDRAARDLADLIASAWKILRDERES
jgi:hypothetical protein